MARQHTIKFNLPGGIIATGDLLTLMTALEKAGVETVQLGNRQQLYCKANNDQLEILASEWAGMALYYEKDTENHPNIVSSYVAEEVFQNAHWLGESLYKDILSLFDYRPSLKINLVDAHQTFIPFFTGHINFISSPVANYWYLCFRFPKTNVTFWWKGLIYSYDISRISKYIETVFLQSREQFYSQFSIGGDLLYNKVQAAGNFIMQPVTAPLSLPEFALPYYEGFNSYGNKNWLGIYRRDEHFPVPFLKELALLCRQQKTGQLYTTPWKSLIIKGIAASERNAWEFLLGKYRINGYHAANELNWQLENLDEEGLSLKRYLVRQFDKEDIRTYGLSFAVKTRPHSRLFGSIIIQKQLNESRNQLKLMDRYDIYYTVNFNPNANEYILFRNGVKKEDLSTFLVSLCKYYYELKNENSEVLHKIYRQEDPVPVNKTITTKAPVHQCPHCLSIYDAQYGDEENGVAAGTVFDKLPADYRCSTCETGKAEFVVTGNPVPVVA